MMIGCFLQTRESPKSPLQHRATFSPLQIDRVCPIINHSHTSSTFEVSEWERAMIIVIVREVMSGGGRCSIMGEKVYTVATFYSVSVSEEIQVRFGIFSLKMFLRFSKPIPVWF